jgi:hypothetical protein
LASLAVQHGYDLATLRHALAGRDVTPLSAALAAFREAGAVDSKTSASLELVDRFRSSAEAARRPKWNTEPWNAKLADSGAFRWHDAPI